MGADAQYMNDGLILDGCIIAHRNDRMGGRLIAMINAMRVADENNLPFRVGWTTHGWTSEEVRTPSDIFAPAFLAQHFFGGEALARIWDDLINLATFDSATPKAMLQQTTQGKSFLSEPAIGQLVLPWEAKETVQKTLPTYFNKIAFSQIVDTAMRRIDDGFKGLALRAYHIRRGDIISDPITSEKLWPNKYIPREFYEIHIRRFLDEGGDRCIVFSDTPAEIDRLKAIDDRIVSFDDVVPHDGLKAGQRDILELYTMSKCPLVFGPPESAFSQTAAATIGGGQVFAVQSSLEEPEQDRAMTLMSKRMAEPKKYFLGDGDIGQNFPFLKSHFERTGEPDKARGIIMNLVDQGFSRSYALSLLSRMSLDSRRLAETEDVLNAARNRPIVTEAAMGDVYALNALYHFTQGDKALAVRRIQAAYWLQPLDKVISGLLSLMQSAGWLNDRNMYPIDDRLLRKKGRLFPQGNEVLNVFNDFDLPSTHEGDGKLYFYPWVMTVRDWRHIHGKKLSRSFWQRGKLNNELGRLVKSSSKISGSAQLRSARSIYLNYMEEHKAAYHEANAAMTAFPDDPLYIKRTADVLLEAGEMEKGLKTLTRAVDASDQNPYFMAHLGFWYGKAKKPDNTYDTFQAIADSKHGSIEIALMTSAILRRKSHTRDKALAILDQAMVECHGSLRMLLSRAQLLFTLERYDEDEDVYRTIARQRTSFPNVFSNIYKTFERKGLKTTAVSIIAESQYTLEEILALADA
jgi:tetratricopeptide (TPR) repeat protein